MVNALIEAIFGLVFGLVDGAIQFVRDKRVNKEQSGKAHLSGKTGKNERDV